MRLPFFVDHGEPCKHCWATVLQANQEGVLPDPEDVEEWDEDDEPDVIRLPRPPQPAARSGSRPGANGHRDPDPKNPLAWKKQLSQLTQRMRSHPVHPPAPLAVAAGRRVVYIVDKSTTMEGRGLIVEVAHESPKKNGAYDRPKQFKMSREQVDALPPTPSTGRSCRCCSGRGGGTTATTGTTTRIPRGGLSCPSPPT